MITYDLWAKINLDKLFIYSVPNEVLKNHYEYFGQLNSTKILLRMMKTLHNNVNDTVKESLYGVIYAFPQLEYQVAHKVVLMPKVCI